MQFIRPALLALSALAIPIIVLYMLRLRRREVTISSTMLWQRLMRDREANMPWQKLRRNLLLLLQLLILAALVIALARPFVPVPSVASGSVALLLDASASMQAADMPGGDTRFEAAQDAARALITDLAADSVVTVIAVGPTPEVLAPPTGDRAVLREAISRAEPTQSSADWESALALAGATVAGREQASIVIISDGGLPDSLPTLPAEVQYVPIGRSGNNVAITALAVRALEGVPVVFVAVTNTGSQPADVILSLTVDGELYTAERLTIPPGETVDQTYDDLPVTTEVIEAALQPPVEGGTVDVLALDDTATAVYAPPVGGRVLLVTEGNLFLAQVLRSIPGIDAYQIEPGELPADPFDLIIFDGWVPGELPQTNMLIINPQQTTNLFVVREPFETTRFVRQVDDPLLAFVDFDEIAVREAMTVEPTGWARTLVEAEGGPLLLAGSQGGHKVAVLTFDLHASDLPLQVAFPLLVANLFEWYAPAQPFDVSGGLTPGDPVVIRPQGEADAYRVTLPDGTRRTFELDADTLTFTETDQLGAYRVDLLAGAETLASRSFAVNLFSPEESDIAPRETIQIGQEPVGGETVEEEFGQREFWQWLAGAALIILIVEWWVYHRGGAITRRERKERAAKPRRGLLYPGRRS